MAITCLVGVDLRHSTVFEVGSLHIPHAEVSTGSHVSIAKLVTGFSSRSVNMHDHGWRRCRYRTEMLLLQ